MAAPAPAADFGQLRHEASIARMNGRHREARELTLRAVAAYRSELAISVRADISRTVAAMRSEGSR